MSFPIRARVWILCGAITAVALVAFLFARPSRTDTPHDLRFFDSGWLEQASDQEMEEAHTWIQAAPPEERRELAHMALSRPGLIHHDALGVLIEVGNKESVPYLLDWLKSQGNLVGDGMICTRAHCLEALEKTTGKKSGLFGGKRKRTAIRDTKTGKIYVSKASCAKNVAAEFGLDPLDSFAWYKIQAQSPDRFVDATEEERAKAEAEDAERLEKIRLEGQARLDAEAAEKAKAEAKPETS